MSYRFMRVIVFFDLPMENGQDRREYAVFRRFLIKSGFVMMQKSVYSKLALTQTAADAIMEAVRKKKPARGTIQALMVTEKQYGRIEYIIGAHTGDVLDTDERFVEL